MAGKYQAYPEYKKSGVEWIGFIPKNWSVSKLGYLINTIVPMRDKPTSLKGEVPWIRIEDFDGKYISGSKSGQGVNKSLIKDMHLKVFPVGTVLCTCSCSMGTTAIVSKPLISNQTFIGLVPDKDLSSEYLYYLMQASEAELTSKSAGAIQQYLSQDEFKALRFGFPLFEEQEKIANFLDHETTKIDTLIEKQQQLIKLLKEKRQAVISHAVTKGLSSLKGSQCPMRDSGVEWLGEVPEHWEIRAVSKLSNKITNGYVGPTRDILVPEGVPYVQATHIKKGKVNFDDAYFVRQSWSDAHAKSILAKSDVLIVQTGAGTGDVGLVSENETGFNCHALIIVQPNKNVISGDYLSMALQSQYGYSVLFSIRTGGMHPHLNCGEVQYVKLPVPPRKEQDEITNYIKQQLLKFDTLVEKQIDAISLMKERRTALISAAVTGKIDVRNWVAPAPPCARNISTSMHVTTPEQKNSNKEDAV